MNDIAMLAAIVAATFVLAGFVKGVVGLGMPTVAMAFLALAMPPAQAAALLVVPSAVTNVWQFLAGGRGSRTRLLVRLWPMMLLSGAVTAGAAGWLMTAQPGAAATALGAALGLYAVLGLAEVRMQVPERLERWLSPAVGAVTGLVTAGTGILAVPSVPYLQALSLDADDLVQALGLSFSVSTLALAAALAHAGIFDVAAAGTSALALLPALAGMVAGQWLRRRIAAPTFRRCFFIALIVLAVHLAV